MTRTTTSARAAVDYGDANEDNAANKPRGSAVYRSVIDAVVSEDDEPDTTANNNANTPTTLAAANEPTWRRRDGHRLSLEDQRKIRKTSLLLTDRDAQQLVHSHTERTRLERLNGLFRSHNAPSLPPRNRIAETVVVTVSAKPRNGSSSVSRPTGLQRWLRLRIKTKQFRAMLYTVVLVDVVALALDERTGEQLSVFNMVDVLCTLLLIVEIVVKSAAFGWFTGREAFFSRSKRLSRALNLLLLLLSLLSYALPYPWRILRGLKTVRCLTLYAGLRRILRSLARAIPFLANVGTLALFFLFAFSIFGLEAYNGAYDRQCAWDSASPAPANSNSTDTTTTTNSSSSLWMALPRMFCAANASCLAPSSCLAVAPPSATVNFDSGLSALFLVFLVVAQDGWVTDIMQPVVEATSRFSVLFFVAIVASMVFLVVNLFVAVITTSFMNFSVESSREKDKNPPSGGAGAGGGGGGGEGEEHVEDEEEEEEEEEDTLRPCRSLMLKMDPLEEATRVSLIMGATLAIEESIHHQQQQQQQQQQQRAAESEPSDKHSSIAKLLARTHHFHSLRDLTADATRELIQNPSSVDELLLATTKMGGVGAGGGRTARAPSIPEDSTIDLVSSPAALTTRSRGGSLVSAVGVASSSSSSVAAASPRRQTKFVLDHAAFSSLNDMLETANGSSSNWFHRFQRVVLSKRFDDAITGCIVANTAFLLVEYRGMAPWVRTMLSVTEYLFGGIFLCEMFARMVAMRGPRRYLRSTERCFDFVVVLCTSGNMVLNNVPSVSFSSLNSISSLRTLRVGRLMLKWEGTRKLIESVLKSSRGVLDVVLFLILFQVVSSIWAMQLFGGRHLAASEDEPAPRWNFDSFPRSFLTLLQVITADQWSAITFDAVNAAEPHVLLVPFLVVNFIVGQYVLLNLFIAVILENFSISEEEAYQLQLEQIIAIPKELDIYEKIEEQGVRAFGEMEQLDHVSNVKLRMFLGLDAGMSTATTTTSTTTTTTTTAFDHQHHHHSAEPTAAKPPPLLRRLCRRVAFSRAFHRVVQLMILVSCVTLMLDDPHPEIQLAPPNGDLELALSVLNRVALGVFVVEFLAKVGALGFGAEYVKLQLFHRDETLGYVKKQAYVEDKWNQLDLFLLLLTVADEIISQASDSTRSAASMFRAGRVLRPLRILNHHHEMKQILSAVVLSLPHVGNVFGLCAIVYVIFGVVGRSLFSGLFFSCNDAQVATIDTCVGWFTTAPDGGMGGAILVPRVWSNARFSFDNIGAAFLTLLEMTSLKWIDKAFATMDIAGAGQQPVQDRAPLHALFCILFVYIGSLFVIRLFVGVLVEQFQRNNGTQILTESQKSWVDLEKFVLLLKPLKRIPRPTATRAQSALFDLCQHRYFGRGIAAAILLNVALLLFNPSASASSSSSSTSETGSSVQVIELLFLAVFLTEALLKCLAFRHHYILSSTGAFELVILGGSLAAYSLATGIHGLIQAGRIFRVMRVLRFVRLNRGVYAVFQTFRASLKPIGHIFFLLLMIFFIFAVVGRQLFGGVRLGPSMNRFSNFRSFSSSFLLLFQIMAGDDWHLTMTDCMLAKPFCVERIHPDTGRFESDCGSPVAAVLFFVTYVTLVVFFLLNLFIAVVLENFRSCYLQDDVCPISLQDFESYKEVFMKYDLHNTGSFPLWQLGSFFEELPPGLRVDRRQHRTAFLQLRSQAQALLESHQQQRCKRPYFNELLRMLCIHQLGIRCLPYEQQRDRVKQIFIYRAKVADMLVESSVKGYVQRWRLRKEREKMAALRRKMVPETASLSSSRERSVARRASGGMGDHLEILQLLQAQQQQQQHAVDANPGCETEPTGEIPTDSPLSETVEQLQSETVDEPVAETMGLMVAEAVDGAIERVRRATAAMVVDHALLVAMTQPPSEPPLEDTEPSKEKKKHHDHHRHHHKHKHKKHKDKHAVVAPRRDADEAPLSDQMAAQCKPKCAGGPLEEPLHAPRRLPKITNKVVPTG